VNRRHLGTLGWNALGLIVFAVMVFPVFWMVTTAFKGNSEIYSFRTSGEMWPTASSSCSPRL
jgi:ABC-type glycerol-3-phosphate transport system permease component